MFELDLTRVDYTWQPAGESQSNTFTAQNIFVSPTTTTAGAVFQATGTISAIPAGYANCAFQSVGAQTTTANNMFDSAGGVVQLVFRRRNGTYAAQTAVLNNQTIAQLDWQGHDGTTVRTQCQILGFAVENFTSTANGTAMSFATTATGTTTLATRLTLTSTTATFSVDTVQYNASVNNSAGTNRAFQWLTGGSARWVARANATSETGSNAGSDFELRRYSDAGADLGAVISINRSNGGTVFANNVTFSTQASVDGAVGTNRLLLYRTSGSNRWAIFADNGAESGSNAGSFLNIARYSDAGGFIDSPILISRSTGITQFNANKIQITTAQTPATSAAAGNAGDIAWDDNYLYVRMSTGWRRIALGAAF